MNNMPNAAVPPKTDFSSITFWGLLLGLSMLASFVSTDGKTSSSGFISSYMTAKPKD